MPPPGSETTPPNLKVSLPIFNLLRTTRSPLRSSRAVVSVGVENFEDALKIGTPTIGNDVGTLSPLLVVVTPTPAPGMVLAGGSPDFELEAVM